LDVDTCHTRSRTEVAEEGSESDGDEDGMLLERRPIQRVVWVV
jgi:hypothetical protein